MPERAEERRAKEAGHAVRVADMVQLAAPSPPWVGVEASEAKEVVLIGDPPQDVMSLGTGVGLPRS